MASGETYSTKSEAASDDCENNTYSSDEPVQRHSPDDSEVPRYSSNSETMPPPPSYESLFGRAKSLKKESSGMFDFVKKVFVNLIGTVVVIIGLGVSLALPVSMLYMGGKYFDDCPLASYIPRCVLAGGILGVIRIFMSIGSLLMGGDEDTGDCCFPKLDAILFVYFISGSIMVYINRDFSTDPESYDFCDSTLYNFSFWLYTSFYILLCVCCCCCCVFVTYAVIADDDDPKTTDIAMTQMGEGGGDA